MLSGLASGFDWKTLVDQLVEVERAPQQRMRTEQTGIDQRNQAFGSIKTQLAILQNRVAALQEPSLFNSRLASVADATVASATVDAGAATGTYKFTITQLATSAELRGTSDIGGALNATSDVSGLVLADAGFSTAVTAGEITVDGHRVSIATTDNLQGVFDKISTATGGAVTGAYDPDTDQITLSSASPIVLGTVTDSSNFLQVARLYNNGTGTVASASALGGARLYAALNQSNLRTSVSDGGSGAGEFEINGVSISYSASADSVSTLLQRINDSAAGVLATYDSTNDRFLLRNKTTGDTGVALEDVTGNFLAAAGLAGGTLQRGNNLIYTINDGPSLVSISNTITEASSGLTGLTVTALEEDTTQVTVTSDTDKIKTAINDFLTEYNKAQSLIDTQTASSTDATGKVTAGTLANDNDATDIASQLRSLAFSQVSGLSGTIQQLAALGIDSNGQDNSLTLSDSAKLDAALATNLGAVRDLFTDADDGLAVRLNAYLDQTVGEDGTLIAHMDALTKESSAIDTQVAEQERLVQDRRQQLIDSFVAMETAQANISQQLQYLQQNFGGSS
jgi:flagellar hook-associated protein 2